MEASNFYASLWAISRCPSHCLCLCVMCTHLATLDKQNIIITVKLSLKYPISMPNHAQRCPNIHQDNDNDSPRLKSCNSKIINVYGLQIAYTHTEKDREETEREEEMQTFHNSHNIIRNLATPPHLKQYIFNPRLFSLDLFTLFFLAWKIKFCFDIAYFRYSVRLCDMA